MTFGNISTFHEWIFIINPAQGRVKKHGIWFFIPPFATTKSRVNLDPRRGVFLEERDIQCLMVHFAYLLTCLITWMLDCPICLICLNCPKCRFAWFSHFARIAPFSWYAQFALGRMTTKLSFSAALAELGNNKEIRFCYWNYILPCWSFEGFPYPATLSTWLGSLVP